MDRRIIYLIVLIVLFGGAWFWWNAYQKPIIVDVTMLIYDPIQCQGNPWEVDWVRQNGDTPEVREYISEHNLEVLESYYERIASVDIMNVKSETVEQYVCKACSCSRGDRITVTVAKANVSKFLGLGFKQLQ